MSFDVIVQTSDSSKLTAKEADKLIWLFVRGVPVMHCAVFLKRDHTVVFSALRAILMGKEPFQPTWSVLALDGTDWTEREEWILKFMRHTHRSPADVAALLGRGVDSIKRHWKEMKARDVWLKAYAQKEGVILPQSDASGGARTKFEAHQNII